MYRKYILFQLFQQMCKKNCHGTAVIHNTSLTKALLSKSNSVVRKGNAKFMALTIYCQDANESWRLSIDSIIATSLPSKPLPGGTNPLLMRLGAVSQYSDMNLDACRDVQHRIYYNDISLKHLLNKGENIPFYILEQISE